METREDTVQFCRWKSFSGIIDRSAGNRPPPRKTIWILVGGNRREPDWFAPEVHRARAGFAPGISPGTAPPPQGAGEERAASRRGGVRSIIILCGEGAMPTTVHCLGEPGDTPRSPEPTWGFNRACTSPIANPERSAPMVAFAPMGRAHSRQRRVGRPQ